MWVLQKDGSYLSDKNPFKATQDSVDPTDWNILCTNPGNPRELSMKEILSAPFFPIPNSPLVLDDGTVFAIKYLQFALTIGQSSVNIAHGISNLITGGKLLGSMFLNNTGISGISDRADYAPGTGTDVLYRLSFSDTNATVTRGTNTTATAAKALMFYKV